MENDVEGQSTNGSCSPSYNLCTLLPGYYAIISASDSLRVILAYREAQSLTDLVVVSKRDKKFLLENMRLKSEGRASIELKSANVYENISRTRSGMF